MIKQSGIQIEMNYSILFSTAIAMNLLATAPVGASNADYNFLIESDWHSCQQISTEYQEVYAFETPSFYVNICQKDNVYFYSGEAKHEDANSIFMTATPLEQNHGFKASNGNVSYIVILPFSPPTSLEDSINTEKAILTIKRNDQLVSVESSLNKYCDPSDAIAFNGTKIDLHSFNYLAAVPQEKISLELSSDDSNTLLSAEMFNSSSRFDFYRLDGESQPLTSCG